MSRSLLPQLVGFRAIAGAFFCCAAVGPGACAWAVFHLASGGTVRGEIVNQKEDPRETYVVKTASGGQIVLAAAQVKKVETQSAAEVKYDRLKLASADTVKGNWELAEFCRENHLGELRKKHLERIIEMEPDHAEARHALKYTQVKGKWITQAQGMNAEGRVKYGNKWLLPQEVELIEAERKSKTATLAWFQTIKRYRAWIDKGNDQGREKITQIDDPYAAKALAHYLEAERDRELKMMWVDALAHVGAPLAMDALLSASLSDADEEVRIACMERLYAANYKPAVRRYIQALKSKDNPMVNLAGVGLGYMKDPSAVPALIDALVTRHKYTIQPGGQPGQMSTSFGGPTGGGAGGGGGPGGFSFGSPQPVVIDRKEQNPEVLRTLVTLAGVNFDFDVRSWKYWYANQKSPASLDARRD